MEKAAKTYPLGLIPNMSNDEYHAAPGTSSSTIKDVMEESLLHYWERNINPDREVEERSRVLDFGTVAHAAVLEPDQLDSLFVTSPPFALRTVNGRAMRDEFEKEHAGVAILTEDEVKAVYAIRDRVHTHPVVSGLFKGGKAEQSYFAKDPRTGQRIKCRPDYLHDNLFAVLDVKTADDASPEGFGRDSAKWKYDISAPWYMDVLEEVCGQMPKHFIFVPIEKKPPYAMGLYYAQPLDIVRARQCMHRHFDRLIKAHEDNKWPDYAEEALPLQLPGWVKR
jgi:hypothetical protein